MNKCDSTTPYYADAVAIAEQLYCPVCQGQSVLSSQAQFAVLVRTDICELLHQGMLKEDIISTLEQRYGTHLRYAEPLQTEMLPLSIGLIAIVIIIIYRLRKLIMVRCND
jgi:cytochrome c-type biogenesis protein CcmH/NrfF